MVLPLVSFCKLISLILQLRELVRMKANANMDDYIECMCFARERQYWERERAVVPKIDTWQSCVRGAFVHTGFSAISIWRHFFVLKVSKKFTKRAAIGISEKNVAAEHRGFQFYTSVIARSLWRARNVYLQIFSIRLRFFFFDIQSSVFRK